MRQFRSAQREPEFLTRALALGFQASDPILKGFTTLAHLNVTRGSFSLKGHHPLLDCGGHQYSGWPLHRRSVSAQNEQNLSSLDMLALTDPRLREHPGHRNVNFDDTARRHQ